MEGKNVDKGKSEDKVRSFVSSQRKGYKRAAEGPNQWIQENAVTLKRYKNRVKQYRQNWLLQSNQSKFYQEFDGKSHEENIIPDKEKTREFWFGIWGKDVNTMKV